MKHGAIVEKQVLKDNLGYLPGVGTSATSGLLLFFLMIDLLFPHPPMKISYIGSTSAAAVVRAM